MISNLIISFYSPHDVVHLVDILTTHHHNKAWQRVFKCRKSSSKNCICQCLTKTNSFLLQIAVYLIIFMFCWASFIALFAMLEPLILKSYKWCPSWKPCYFRPFFCCPNNRYQVEFRQGLLGKMNRVVEFHSVSGEIQ